jgi:Ca2+-binding EF-hand superfamily protein
MVNFVKGFGDQAELQKCFQELDLNGDGMLSLY